MKRRKLRPINDTRGPNGQFTSETAFRLHQRRAALHRVRQNRAEGFQQLAEARELRRLYRVMKEGKSDPRLTQDGCYPGCRCICHIRPKEDPAVAWARLGEAEKRLLFGPCPWPDRSKEIL